jgi:hypothetical protein
MKTPMVPIVRGNAARLSRIVNGINAPVGGGKESTMRSFKKRLAELERGLQRDDPIILKMPDGSTVKLLVGPGDGLSDLLARSIREMVAGVGFSRDVDTIRRSIGGTERGGHLIELCRALLNSPQ